jgi:hypothetical protein
MAAHATVRRRVERILAENVVPSRLTLRKVTMIAIALIPAVLAAASVSTAGGDDLALIQSRLAEQARPRTAISLDPAALDQFAGYYALPWSPELPFKVHRDGDHLLAGPIGLDGMELRPESSHGFYAVQGHAQQEFQLDALGRVTALVLHQNGHVFTADRLDEASGRALETALADRVAANRPQAGSEAALRSHIEQLQRGEIDARTVTAGMADAIRTMLPNLQPQKMALGAVRETRFTGVGPDGMDHFTVTYEKGAELWSIRLTPDGRIEAMWFSAAT